ncbi:MAG: GNAT family N-acetyltransferase [Propionibacteriaceae bacterium]|nr:GNAT family N-acetyltransferase [Propionibacteriaceae bacterium]
MIRKAIPEEAPEIRRLHARSWRVTYPNDEYGVTQAWVDEFTNGWLTEDALAGSIEFLRGVLEEPNSFYRIAEVDGQIAGFVHAIRHSENDAEVMGIYCDPSMIGTGVGAQLMDAAMEWIGPGQARLDVAPYNQRAIRFYQRYGFRVVEGSQHLFNVMPWVDLQGPDHGQAGLQINVNAIPTVDMERDKGD